MASRPVEAAPGATPPAIDPIPAPPAPSPSINAATPTSPAAPARPLRIPLGASARRISYERRIRLWLTALALPSVLLLTALVHAEIGSLPLALGSAVALAVVWAIAAAAFFDQLVRPLQTLANVVAALREDDFSFRARGARRGDSLGDLALEINALAGTLQGQRSPARDALTLVERVMTAMPSPVLAFGPDGTLRLLNQAAEVSFRISRRSVIGRSATQLGFRSLLEVGDEGLYSHAGAPTGPLRSETPGQTRWSVRRTNFRLHGVPHTLLVLSDVNAALREEERIAWQRLIRVLSHEINNSLTPIKSIAGSLRTRLPELERSAPPGTTTDFHRGLSVVEERAASLNRFLQAYQQLTHLPPPQLRSVSLQPLIEQVISLETRLPVQLQTGPGLEILCDPDQLQQLLINLVRNAVEAALSPDANLQSPATAPRVEISWSSTPTQLILEIRDTGPGLTNPANLFVPFYTTKTNGSGIGLVLAQQIAAAHKGSITLQNRKGTPGCIAELLFPLAIV